MKVVYEDNHLVIVDKLPGEIVQGDKTGDTPLSEQLKLWLKEKYNKPGNVFVGVVHRLDRPVEGLVVFAKTSKALTRMCELFRKGDVHKTYRALVQGCPREKEGVLTEWLLSDGRINKTFIVKPDTPGAKLSKLAYRTVAVGDKYSVVEVNLLTGRKHQIRAMLAGIGNPIKGDLKYGAKRSNPDGGISLQAFHVDFIHPVSKLPISIDLDPPAEMQKIIKSAAGAQ